MTHKSPNLARRRAKKKRVMRKLKELHQRFTKSGKYGGLRKAGGC